MIRVVLGICALAVALPAQKRVADQREYELFRQAVMSQDAERRIAIVEQWTAEYPKSDFHRDRLLFHALALETMSEYDRALVCALEAVKMEPRDPGAARLALQLAPWVHSPKPGQVAAVKAAARVLESAPRPMDPPRAEDGVSDAESQRVSTMLRQWRQSSHTRRSRAASEFERDTRRLIERALAWAVEHSR